MYTKPADSLKILNYVRRDLTIYECCWGRGDMGEAFKADGRGVFGEVGLDFFSAEGQMALSNADVIITNPPFRTRRHFIRPVIDSGKPFAFLLRVEHLGGVTASHLYEGIDLELLIPRRRIQFITPKMRQGLKVGGIAFHCCWFTRGLGIGKVIAYID